jgi:hypothetical protein
VIAAAAHFGDVVLLSREEPANQRALFCPPAGTLIKEVRFAGDSPLEGDGFELPVPREKKSRNRFPRRFDREMRSR